MAKQLEMIVQLPLAGDWGTEAQQAAYLDAADAIAEGFDENGLGEFDGNDYGSGTMNLFIYEIPAGRWEDALRFVLETLAAHDLKERAVIARTDMGSGEDDDDEGADLPDEVVVWPPDFKGEFSLI